MIITTMLLMIAALAVVVIGFIMDRLAIRKLERGMRTLAKRIKALERDTMSGTGLTIEPTWVTDKAITDEPCIFWRNDDEMDTDTDKETQAEDDSTPTDKADGEV